MHYLKTQQYTYLAGEINALYHEAAVKAGISDSIQNILYVICENGTSCLQSEISKLTGISRQTINSALRTLEKEDIVNLKPGTGRNRIVGLNRKGEKYASEKIKPLLEIENMIWQEWTPEEQREYLRLTEKYRDALKKHLETML